MFAIGDKVRAPSTGAIGTIVEERAAPPFGKEVCVETSYESAYKSRQLSARTWWPVRYLEAYTESSDG